MEQMIFYARLTEKRKEKGYKQFEVAQLLGMSQGGYGKIENGQREPNLMTLIKLSELLEVSVDYLLGIEKEVPKEEPRSVKITIDGIEIDISVNKKEPSSKEDSSTD